MLNLAGPQEGCGKEEKKPGAIWELEISNQKAPSDGALVADV